MSVQMLQSKIERTRREITSLQQKLIDESKKETAKSKQISQIKQSMSRTTSASTVQSKLREIERLERDINTSKDKQITISKQITSKTTDLHSSEQQLFKEQGREQKKLQDAVNEREQEMRRMQDQLLQQAKQRTISHVMNDDHEVETDELSHDVFISHASEDKDDLVRPLAEQLREAGFSVWYDEFQLKIGDNLRRSIDKGLAKSKFGIVVLSPSFFAKNWPQYELDGLLAREMSEGKVILPLWHKISKNEVMSYSPSLVDKIALNTSMYTIEEIVEKLAEVLRY